MRIESKIESFSSLKSLIRLKKKQANHLRKLRNLNLKLTRYLMTKFLKQTIGNTLTNSIQSFFILKIWLQITLTMVRWIKLRLIKSPSKLLQLGKHKLLFNKLAWLILLTRHSKIHIINLLTLFITFITSINHQCPFLKVTLKLLTTLLRFPL